MGEGSRAWGVERGEERGRVCRGGEGGGLRQVTG